ncbi:MAG: glycosyltransferase family 9 protein, partial [Leptonema sp. (in: Bacteria)]|nr:glycosyltransferase family 9 protein [Leptonema sp. (in: bacteria)]
TPMLRALRQCHKNAEITILVKPEAAPFLEGLPFVDHVLKFDKGKAHKYGGMINMIRTIRAAKYNLLLSPHQSHRTGILALFSGIPVRYGYKTAGFARLAYHHRLTRDTSKHEIYRLLSFLSDGFCPELAKLPNLNSTLTLAESSSSSEKSELLIKSISSQPKTSKPILLAVSSVWPTKRWTPYGFAELAGLLFNNYRQEILLIGSKADSSIAEQVLSIAKQILPQETISHIHNICGQTDLVTLYSLMRRSLVVVSNDSAPVHFGCAAAVPVVAIFGPTIPAFGYAPIAPRTAVAQIDLYCRPCSTHGSLQCPEKHFRCMRELTAEMVFEKVKQVVNEPM